LVTTNCSISPSRFIPTSIANPEINHKLPRHSSELRVAVVEVYATNSIKVIGHPTQQFYLKNSTMKAKKPTKQHSKNNCIHSLKKKKQKTAHYFPLC
jgi:Tfp pilus assembly PilM family ATPase